MNSRSLLLTLLALALACQRGTSHPPDANGNAAEHAPEHGDAAEVGPGYPGELIDTAQMGRNFIARQKLEGRFGEQKFAFEAVLQFYDGKLTVLGMTPFGTKAFVLEQSGLEVSFQALVDREIPFPPEYMMQDIHRAWLWHARLPWGSEAPEGGEGSCEVAGERVVERWTADGLVSRSFERLDGRPAGAIRLEYVGGHQLERPAKRVLLDNGWFGYHLEIETTDWRWL